MTVEGIAWRFRTSAPWRDVPERFGHWNSIFQRFADWAADGTWARVLVSDWTVAGCSPPVVPVVALAVLGLTDPSVVGWATGALGFVL